MKTSAIRRIIQTGGAVVVGAVVGALVAQGATPWIGPGQAPSGGNPDLVVLGLGVAQVDTSANPSVWIEDTGGDDLIRLDNTNLGATPEFVVGNDGAVLIGPASGTTGAGGNPANEPLEFDVFGDANATRLCLDGVCRDNWAAVLSGGGSAGNENYVVKWNTAGDGIEDTEAPIYDDGLGNVGINTTSPAYTLDVNGPANALELCIAGTCITAWSEVLNTGSGTTTDNYLPKWASGGTELEDSSVYETPGGFVGIGTETPAERLEVVGNLLLSGAGGTSISAGTDDNRLNIYNQTGSGNSRAWIEMWGSGGRTGELTLGGTNIAFFTGSTTGGTGTQTMYLTAAGNLGIGVAAPGFQLDVLNQANADELCLDGDCRDNWGEVLTGGTTGTANRLVKWNAAGNGFVDTVAPIDENGSGNVGIGTAPSGSYRLNVGGDANATRICIAGSCQSSWSAVGVGTDNQFLFESVATPSGTAVADSATDTLTFSESGGIDISTSGDNITFDINSGVVQDRVSGECFGGTAIQTIGSSGTVTCVSPPPSGNWTLSGSNLYANSTSWNVGIGTTGPSANLDVRYTAGTGGIYSVGPSGNTHLPWTNGWNYISGNGIIFRDTGNTERMRYVASTGRLGINTTGPSYPLDVNGQMRASRYYDDNTTYYIDSNVTSNINALRMVGRITLNNTGPTIVMQDTNNISAMMHVNSNRFYILRGCGVNSTTWCTVNGRWPLYFDLNNNDAIFGGGIDVRSSRDGVIIGRSSTGAYRAVFSARNSAGAQVMWIANDGDYWTNTGTMSALAFFYTSDESVKKDILPIRDALNKILQIEGVTFTWKATDEPGIGLIAQDVERVFPELVEVDRETGLKKLDYGALNGPIIQAIKEQQPQIDALESLLYRLEGELQRLE